MRVHSQAAKEYRAIKKSRGGSGSVPCFPTGPRLSRVIVFQSYFVHSSTVHTQRIVQTNFDSSVFILTEAPFIPRFAQRVFGHSLAKSEDTRVQLSISGKETNSGPS